jgi:SAM-dependent methyltransferase
MSERIRRRQGDVRIRDGIPYANRDTTLSLFPAAKVAHFLARNRDCFKGDLLDNGCGNAPFAEWYRPLVDRVVKLDAAPIPSVDVVAFSDALPFADGSFDTILATEIFDHVTDAERAADDAYRVLRPGGHLVVTVPYMYPTHEAPYDFRRFTHFGLQSLLERHGFEVISVDAKGGPVLMLAHFALLAIAQFVDLVGKVLLRGRYATDLNVFRVPLWAPQEALVGSLGRRSGVSRLAARLSLGYMAVGRRPVS